MASIASLLVPGVSIPTPDTSWIGGAADSIVGGIDKYKQNKSFNKLADLIGQQPGQQAAQMAQPTQTGFLAGLGSRQQPQTMAAPLTAVDRSAPQGDTYQPFIDTVKGKITNPYGLAAVAATGRAESGWSSGNANRTWSDPSQTGQPGTAGGVMSWRGPRLEAMQNFAAQKGERLGSISPQTQAEFFLQEDPNLIATLNSARSPEEAADAMAKAWAFAGHDNPGQGEAARRRAMTTNYAAQFRDMPNAGLAAIDAQAAPSGSLSGDPAVTVADPLAYGAGQAPATDPALQSIAGQPLPDQAFDDRFGPTALPAEIVQGADDLAGALASSNSSDPVPTPLDGVTSAIQAPATQTQPVQVADASGGFAGAPAVTPIPRGGADISLIQTMLRDPNLRQAGLQLWQQNVLGPKASEPWQFVQGPDGTLLRANQQTGQIEPVGNFAKPRDSKGVVVGGNVVNPDTGEVVYTGPQDKPTDDIREYNFAKQQGFTGSFAEWQQQASKRNQTNINVNNGSDSGAFYKKADELRAGTVVDTANAGNDAQRRLIQVDQLDGLLKNVDTGGLAAAKQMAGDWGINTEGLSDIQATAALISQMVPSQRAPGSGTMSDADLALFKQSLPRIINQPGGNEMIIKTMRGIANYDQQIGDIANRVLNREITPAEGQKQMRSVTNPLANFGATAQPAGKGGRGGVSRPKTDADFNALPSGAIYIDPDDGQQYRKP